jgi:hypothetical protein
MKTRTKAAILKALKKECAALAKARDNLRELEDELSMQVEASDEATELLESCIDKLSELN